MGPRPPRTLPHLLNLLPVQRSSDGLLRRRKERRTPTPQRRNEFLSRSICRNDEGTQCQRHNRRRHPRRRLRRRRPHRPRKHPHSRRSLRMQPKVPPLESLVFYRKKLRLHPLGPGLQTLTTSSHQKDSTSMKNQSKKSLPSSKSSPSPTLKGKSSSISTPKSPVKQQKLRSSSGEKHSKSG